MVEPSGPLGVFGGAFDPVHNGHMRCVVELREQLCLEQLLLIPTGNPPHREPQLATPAQRIGMLEVACAGFDWCHVDMREINRTEPSYTVDTLSELRVEHSQRSIVLLVGMDAFLNLPSWYEWERLFELAHIAVVRRPGSELPDSGIIAELLAERRCDDKQQFMTQPAGCIFLADVPLLDIASSRIRRLLATERDPRFLLPDGVLALIKASGCYGQM